MWASFNTIKDIEQKVEIGRTRSSSALGLRLELTPLDLLDLDFSASIITWANSL